MSTKLDVSIRELKSHLSELLNKVVAGEQLTVTRRGRPIATVNAASRPAAQDPLEQLAKASWVTPPSKSKRQLGARKPLPSGSEEKSLSDIVREERG